MQALLAGIRPTLALILLCLVLYLPGLASIPPLDRDEARFAQASKQMMETGDYVRIWFQDQPRTKKPVGIHWMQAGAVTLLDAPLDAIWAYRLPSALAALAAVLLTFLLGQTLVGRAAAFLGAAFLAASVMVTLEAHQAKTDAVLLACTVAAQGVLARFYLQKRGGKAPGQGLILLFWLAQGLGILVKGPIVPLISLMTIAALGIAERSLGWLHNIRPVMGLALVAAIVGPWAAAVSQASQGSFIGSAVKTDLLPKLLGAQESHGGPPGLYLAMLPLMLWPASLFALPALPAAWRERTAVNIRFLLAWLIPSWLLFELIPTKLPHYVLPLYPALALLAATWVLRRPAGAVGRGARLLAGLWSLLGVALAAAAVAAPLGMGKGLIWWSLPAAVAALAVGLLPLRPFFQGDMPRAAVMALAAATVALPVLFHGVMPALDRMWVSRALAKTVSRIHPAGPVALAGFTEPSAVFLLGTATRLGDGANAARLLLEQPGALAAIERREDEAFRQALGERPVILLETVEGFNYSRGRAVSLGLYMLPGKER